ncbi:MAG: hypothetical protein JWO38_147 [Gemmataceae bacterium]|nr:hypothetical protein [Gemmataceae bacterium]
MLNREEEIANYYNVNRYGELATIPNHLLSDRTPDDRIPVPARSGEIHFLIHPAPDAIGAHAVREGSRVASSLRPLSTASVRSPVE